MKMETSCKNIFITGGHYTPAKAVIDRLLNNGWQVFYIGLKHSFEGDRGMSYEYLELQKVPRVTFLQITTGRIQRKLTRYTIPSIFKIPIGFVLSLFWLTRYQPDVVLSFGGFVAIPVVMAAWLLDIPIVTHEQTTAFGLANRVIQLFANKVLVSFSSTLPKNTGGKWIYTGNPIREQTFMVKPDNDLSQLKRLKDKLKLPVVYITGGKHGSHVINKTVGESLEVLLKSSILIVQTGDNQEFKDFGWLTAKISNLAPEMKKRLFIYKFISGELIGAVYNLADLVVGRAGANTVFDLAALGKPAILIPIPWSSGDEQRKNAAELANVGGVVVLSQDNIKNLPRTITGVLAKIEVYRQRALGAKSLVNLDSAQKIFQVVQSQLHD